MEYVRSTDLSGRQYIAVNVLHGGSSFNYLTTVGVCHVPIWSWTAHALRTFSILFDVRISRTTCLASVTGSYDTPLMLIAGQWDLKVFPKEFGWLLNVSTDQLLVLTTSGVMVESFKEVDPPYQSTNFTTCYLIAHLKRIRNIVRDGMLHPERSARTTAGRRDGMLRQATWGT